jgi:hypothetical protein
VGRLTPSRSAQVAGDFLTDRRGPRRRNRSRRDDRVGAEDSRQTASLMLEKQSRSVQGVGTAGTHGGRTGEHAVPRAQKHRGEQLLARGRGAHRSPRARQRSARRIRDPQASSTSRAAEERTGVLARGRGGTADPRSTGEQFLARGRAAPRAQERTAEERTGAHGRGAQERAADPQRRVGAEQPRRRTGAQGVGGGQERRGGRIRDGGG